MPKIIHNTRKDILYSATTPINNLTPSFVGQQCITEDDKMFFAKGLTNKDWIQSGSSSANDISMDNGVSVEASIKSLQSEVGTNKTNLITEYNNIVDLLL